MHTRKKRRPTIEELPVFPLCHTCVVGSCGDVVVRRKRPLMVLRRCSPLWLAGRLSSRGSTRGVNPVFPDLRNTDNRRTGGDWPLLLLVLPLP